MCGFRGLRVAVPCLVHQRRGMRRAGLFTAAVVSCFALTASAQVSNTTEPPKAPTYTPEQLFGSSSPRSSSPGSEPSRETAPTQAPAIPPRPQTTPLLTTSQSACAPAPAAGPNASAFPGVSASQLPRAGVSADAFTRPGVSADQLRTLIPGHRSEACPVSRDPVLHPDPINPPRRIPTATDEQQSR